MNWLEELKAQQEVDSSLPSGVLFDRLRAQGIIDERGEVTGHLRRWDAFLAITEVRHANGADKITMFRCLKPVFGMPGGATIDISRDSLVKYLKEGKKVITAPKDDRLGIWTEGSDVHLSAAGFIRTDQADDNQDEVGGLPEFQQPIGKSNGSG